jgi:hypothetical protein
MGAEAARKLSATLAAGAQDGSSSPLRADNYRELVALVTDLGIERVQVGLMSNHKQQSSLAGQK